MKRVGALLALAILAVSLSSVRAQDKKSETASELKALDAKLTEAFKNHDVKTIEASLAPGFLDIDPRGMLHTRSKYLEYIGKSAAKFDELKETDVKVRVFGETALVTGLLHLKGKVGEKDISGEYRWTRVYTSKDGKWLVVTEQHTYVLPKDEK